MTKKKKIIFYIVTPLVILGVLLIFIPWGDEPPPKDDDLILSYGTIPDDENAYYYLTQLKGKVTGLELAEDLRVTKMRKGEEKWDDSLLEKYEKKNEEAFKILEKTLACNTYEPPSPTHDPHYSNYFQRTPIRELARQLSYSAYKKISEDRDAEALDTAFKILKLGQLMESGMGASTDYMTGDAIKSIGFGIIRKCAETTKLDTNTLKSYLTELMIYRADEQGLINSIKREYMYISLYLIKEVENGKFPISGFDEDYRLYPKNLGIGGLLKPNATRRVVAEKCRQVISKFPKTLNEMGPLKKLSEIPMMQSGDVPFGERLPIGSNKAGKIIFKYCTAFFDQQLLMKCRENAKADATRVFLALKCYKLDHGELPETLDELVPEYLDKVPIDEFDNKPIKYSKKDQIVYSVGPDMKDSEGKKERGHTADGKEYFIHDDEGYKIEF